MQSQIGGVAELRKGPMRDGPNKCIEYKSTCDSTSNVCLSNCTTCYSFCIQCCLQVPVDMCDVQDGIWDEAGSQMLPVNDCLSVLSAPRHNL